MEKNYEESITVVVPVFNSSPYLAKLFVCLDQQTCQSYQLIFVYDQSDDDGLLRLQRYQLTKIEKKITILIKPNREGLGRARDYALDSGLILTKYVIFLDADDSFEPSFLAKLLNSAEKNKADMSMCGFDRVDEVTQKQISIDMVHNPEVISSVQTSHEIAFLNNSVWNKLMKTSTVGDVRYIYRGGESEDEMFYLKFVPKCQKISFVNEVLYHYFVRSSGLGLSVNLQTFFRTENDYLDIKKIYNSSPLIYQKFEPLLESSVFIHFCIGTVTKIAIADKKQKKIVIKESRRFLTDNFPKWARNPFYSLKASFKGGPKVFMIWCCKLLYILHLFGLFIFAYKTYIKTFKKDIKW